jgi:drug/metabolite transporter (DMT)-like permease
LLPIILGLASALSWGTGDFAGGLAARKVGPYRAVMFAEAIGLGAILIVLPFFPEAFPDMHSILWSAAAGIVGTVGLLAFFEAMRRGRLSVVAPLSALLGAVVPVVAGIFVDGLPKLIVFLAFGLALVAIVLISREKVPEDAGKTAPYLHIPLLSGIAFGFYFVIMHEASQDYFWGPLVVARSTGMLSIAAYLLIIRGDFSVPSGSWHLLAVNGIFDVGGNAFYILAGQAGRMDVSAVLGSLYPGMTVFLAWLLLKEKLQLSQWAGILLAFIAIALITTA